jgi:hypothetical protein
MLPQNEGHIGPSLPPLVDVLREVVPDAGSPVRVSRTGPLVDYSAELKAQPGSRAGAGKFLGVLDQEPALAKQLNESSQIPKDVLALHDRDQDLAAAHGLATREDVQNMRRIIGEGSPGFVDRLRAAYARGQLLPAAMLAALDGNAGGSWSWGDFAEQRGQRRISGQRIPGWRPARQPRSARSDGRGDNGWPARNSRKTAFDRSTMYFDPATLK